MYYSSYGRRIRWVLSVIMLNGRNSVIYNVVTRTSCRALIHQLVFLALLEFANSHEIENDFNDVSCQINSPLLQQNVSINQKSSANSTVELRSKCRSIDPSCSCDSPQVLRCHNPEISKLNGIITRVAEAAELDIKMIDWNLLGLRVFKKKIFLTSIQKAKTNLHLVGLFVSSNGTLRIIEDGAFLGLRNDIRNLGLSDNNLGPEIPQEIFSLPDLRQLDISRNNISTLRSIPNPNTSSLNYLDLSENNLERINDISENLFPQSLCALKVSYNRLTLDGLSGANFAKIGFLDLSHNEISGNLTKYIFNGTGGKHMEKLHLNYNQIRNIGENSFCGLPKLKHLWLSHNNIEGLDKKSFMCLKHLSYINLSHNRILDITKGLFEPLSSSLKVLILSNNHLSLVGDSPITSVPLSTLTYLDLQNNDINKIEGKCFQTLPHLETLLLGGKFRPGSTYNIYLSMFNLYT